MAQGKISSKQQEILDYIKSQILEKSDFRLLCVTSVKLYI